MLDPAFREVLGRFRVDDLDRDASSIVGLWPDLTIAYQNEGWRAFALANGGADVLERWPLGASITSAISGPLRGYYEAMFRRALAQRSALAHPYLCSSETVERALHMTAYPLDGRGLLLVHSLRVEVPRDEPAEVADDARYRRADGVIAQCSCCRRTRRADVEAPQWDWVPGLVSARASGVSHGLCQPCADFYYPDL